MKTPYLIIPTLLAGLGLASASHADFLDRLRDVVSDTAQRTVEQIAAETTRDMIRGMVIGYTTVQTRSDEEVAEEYSREQGSLPENTTVTTYRTRMMPGNAVSPGAEVTVKSYIEVVRGRSGRRAVLEERLTIWDNEDNTVALKSMTKEAGEQAGGFTGEFTFSLPEGLPQGIYPVSSDLMLNGELVGDERHELQLVLWRDEQGSSSMQLARGIR